MRGEINENEEEKKHETFKVSLHLRKSFLKYFQLLVHLVTLKHANEQDLRVIH